VDVWLPSHVRTALIYVFRRFRSDGGDPDCRLPDQLRRGI
jgi:hypothetical protein